MSDPVEAMFRNPREALPVDGQVVIVFRVGGEQEQCEWKDGKPYVWRYGITDQVFCEVDQITWWRGCTGFDF